MVLSHFFLKDPCNILRFASTFGLVGGIVLIFQLQNYISSKTEDFQTAKAETFLNLTNQISTSKFNLSYVNSSQTRTSEIPNEAKDELLGCTYSVVALVCAATSAVLMKKSTQNFDKLAIILFIGIAIGIVGCLQLMIFEPRAPTNPGSFFPWMIAEIIAFLGMLQQLCLITALKLDSASRVMVMRSMQIIFSFAVQVLISSTLYVRKSFF
jgi:drug/metabolite transporter (DMT)-like permease